MKKILLVIFMLNACVFSAIFADENIFLTELHSKNADYYSGKRFIPVSEIEAILGGIENSTTVTDDERLFLKLEAYALWANNSIPLGTFREDYPTLKKMYSSVRETQAFRNGSLSSNAYAAFAEFATALIPLADIAKDAYVYNLDVDEKEYARVALVKDPDSIRASALYGMLNAMGIKYKDSQAYAESLKLLQDTEGLPEYMVFRTYIYRSMMYMKINEIEKSFKELEKAENMYPNAFFVSMLKDSYVNGGTGFNDTDRGDLGNF